MATAASYDIVRRDNAYFVEMDGKPVFGPSHHRNLALDALDRLKHGANLQMRNCMVCKTEFESEGPHNRLCTLCRRLSHYDGSA